MRRNNDPEKSGRAGEAGPLSRRFLRIQDLTLALAVIVACGGFLLYRSRTVEQGANAVIYLDGEEIRRVPLREGDDYRIGLAEEYGVPVSFVVQGGRIRFVDVTCPDHICEKTGFIAHEGQTAVCMPNRVAVHIIE